MGEGLIAREGFSAIYTGRTSGIDDSEALDDSGGILTEPVAELDSAAVEGYGEEVPAARHIQ